MTPQRWTDVPADGERRHVRRTYMVANGFELMLAVAAILGAVAYMIDPTTIRDASLGVKLHALVYVWEAQYLLGGLAVVVGLAAPLWRIELAGLSLLSSAIAMNAAAIVVVHGLHGAPTALFYGGWCAAAAARVWLILRIARLGERAS